MFTVGGVITIIFLWYGTPESGFPRNASELKFSEQYLLSTKCFWRRVCWWEGQERKDTTLSPLRSLLSFWNGRVNCKIFKILIFFITICPFYALFHTLPPKLAITTLLSMSMSSLSLFAESLKAPYTHTQHTTTTRAVWLLQFVSLICGRWILKDITYWAALCLLPHIYLHN